MSQEEMQVGFEKEPKTAERVLKDIIKKRLEQIDRGEAKRPGLLAHPEHIKAAAQLALDFLEGRALPLNKKMEATLRDGITFIGGEAGRGEITTSQMMISSLQLVELIENSHLKSKQ